MTPAMHSAWRVFAFHIITDWSIRATYCYARPRRVYVGEAQPVRTSALFIAGIVAGCVAVVWLPFAAITLMAAFT